MWVDQRARDVIGRPRRRVTEMMAQARMRRRLRNWVANTPPAEPLHYPPGGRTTVVVPCYNHARHLPFAVQSLCDQTLTEFDSVLVNDCSSDETGDMLPELADLLRHKGTVILVSHRQNQGQAASLNAGIHLARTPLVTVFNDDDWLRPHALSSIVKAFETNPDIGLVGVGSLHFSGYGVPHIREDEIEQPRPPRRVEPSETRAIRSFRELNMTHSGMTLSREAWRRVGGYRSQIDQRVVRFSDRDLQLRIGTLYPVILLEETLVCWRSDSSVDAGLNS